MKKKQRCFLRLMLTNFFLCSLVMTALGKEVGWYFKKNYEHKQPIVDENLSFIQKYPCYYVDTKHGDDCAEKVIYLTFDAGYENGNIKKILDVLKAKNVQGTFFVLRHLLENETDLVSRMLHDGHMVANHTMSHKNMAKVTDRSEFERELHGLEELFTEKTGQSMPKIYRPPEGKFSEENLQLLKELGYKTVFWSFAYADWDNEKQMSPEAAKKKIIDGTHNGEILLLHPTSATNAAILGDLIDTWREMGYTFATLGTL